MWLESTHDTPAMAPSAAGPVSRPVSNLEMSLQEGQGENNGCIDDDVFENFLGNVFNYMDFKAEAGFVKAMQVSTDKILL
jgi:hypothetical protein